MRKGLALLSHGWRQVDQAQIDKGAVEAALPFRDRCKVGSAALLEQTRARRKDLVKGLRQMAEEARVRVRAHRRTAIDEGKKLQKSGELTEDGLRDLEADVQKLTDKFVKTIDENFERKEAEVMKV